MSKRQQGFLILELVPENSPFSLCMYIPTLCHCRFSFVVTTGGALSVLKLCACVCVHMCARVHGVCVCVCVVFMCMLLW